MKQPEHQSRWAAVRPVLPRAAVILVAVTTACLMLAQLWAQWSSLHPIDKFTYNLRGALRVDIHTGCCGAEQRWKELEAAKRIMPKALTFQDMTPQQLREELPVRVISLARATERRTKLIKTLDAAGVTYAIVDAVDAANTSIPLSEVKKFVRGVRLKYWINADTYKFQRQKVAVDLSHFQSLERIARENRAAVILEDDAGIAEAKGDNDAWYRDLLAALQELPQDWHILYLNFCYEKLGAPIRKHLQVVREAACTIGYVASPEFARKVLREVKRANRHLRTPVIDWLYSDLMQHWEIAAYVTVPRLVNLTSVASTMDYAAASANLTEWDKWWGLGRRLRGFHSKLK